MQQLLFLAFSELLDQADELRVGLAGLAVRLDPFPKMSQTGGGRKPVMTANFPLQTGGGGAALQGGCVHLKSDRELDDFLRLGNPFAGKNLPNVFITERKRVSLIKSLERGMPLLIEGAPQNIGEGGVQNFLWIS